MRSTLSHCLLYLFSSTQAGCTSEAQSWEKMVKFVEGQNKETAWSKTVCTSAKTELSGEICTGTLQRENDRNKGKRGKK